MKTGFFRAVWALLCSGLLSCSKPLGTDDPFVDDLADALHKGDRSALRLADATSFDWDQVFIFPPYTSMENIFARIEVAAVPAIERSGIDERDDACLLVFLDKRQLSKVAIVPRGKVDFAGIGEAGPLSPEVAVFRGEESEGVLRLHRMQYR